MAKFNMANLWLVLCIAVSSSSGLLTPNTPKYIRTYDEYAKRCAPTIKCNATAKYRTIDGLCNNLKTPWLGAVKTPHLRILDAEYADGKYKFRKQSDGRPLPNAREIQVKVFLDKQSWLMDNNNVLFMEWGQFIAHDITLLPADTSAGADCCALQKQRPVPVQCQAVVKVPKNDPVYSGYGQTCINFNRAVTSAADGCQLKHTTFMVGTTHYIDGSHIYGTDENTSNSLRSFQGGRLRSEKNSHHMEFCPQKKRGKSTVCGTSKNSSVCYVAGDPRVNQNLGIALFQNAFLRFHNVVAAHLKNHNPHWSDDILYQEARRFVVAIIQHITYAKYLPILLGTEFASLNEQTVYDKQVNPSTSQEFASGAFRILHSQIPSVLSLLHYTHYIQVPLTDWMDKPDLLPMPANFDGFFDGLLKQYTRAEQPSYNPDISNDLFKQTTPRFKGQDLLTADIQRGRDTGIPPYNKMRAVCEIPVAETFDDLVDLIDEENVDKLRELYSSVDDIDLIVGALLERHEPGTKVGPTAKCIISDSFYRYKTGDRFFYDVLEQPGSFTPDQLETIKNISFNNVICATSGLQVLPEDIFSPPNWSTEQYSCKHFPIDLEAWKENTELPRTPTQKLGQETKPHKKVSKK